MMKKMFLCVFVALFAITGMCTAEIVYSVDFTQSKQGWTIENKNLGGLNYVWYQNDYGMAASAYFSGKNHITESWLISPEINLTSVSHAQLILNQAVNKGWAMNLKVMASIDNGDTWNTIHISMPAGDSWNYQTDVAIIDKYAGQKIRLAFVYVGTSSICPTWEIRQVMIYETSIVTIDGMHFLCNYDGTASLIAIQKEQQMSIDIPGTILYKGQTYSVTSIGNDVFSGCTGLTSVTIPNSVTSIGDDAFSGCTGLTFITIPESVTSIGSWAFSGCTALSVTIPNTVTSIEYRAFGNVLNIVYNGPATGSPWGARAINGYAEGNLVYESAAKTKVIACNSSVTEIIIPEGVTSIRESVFYGCSLRSIILPSTLTHIGKEAFGNCEKLRRIDCWAVEPPQCDENPFSSVYDVSLYVPKQSIETYTATFPWNEITRPNIGNHRIYPIGIAEKQLINGFYYDLDTLNITASLVGAEDKTIIDLTVLDNIRWQEKTYPVTAIGDRAFWSESGYQFQLKSIKLGENVQYIGSYAFPPSLTSITFNEGLKYIGSYAFSSSSLSSVVLPEGLKYIGDAAFESSSLSSITLPEGLKYIGDNCFAHCEALTSLSIPNTVDSIGKHICSCCYYLATVSLGKGLKKIGYNAFGDCTRLASLHLPDSVTEIPDYLCSCCYQLRTVSMGNVVSIGENAFTACRNLLTIDVKAPIPPVCADQAFSGDVSGSNVPYDATITVPCYASDAYRTTLHWNQFYNYQEQYFYFDAVSEDNEKGRVFITQKPTCDEPVAQIKAVPMTGYQFTAWSDGNTENPRTLIAEMEMKLIAHFQSTTAIDNTEAKNAALVQKIIRNGQVFILRGNEVYTVLGEKVK